MKRATKKLFFRTAVATYLRRTPPVQLLKYALLQEGEHISYELDQKKIQFMNLVNKVCEETELLMEKSEACQICIITHVTERIYGDIAEVGVYKGATAKLICEVKGKRPLYLFDTFEGLPQTDKIVDAQFHTGQFAARLVEVQQLLKYYPNVFIFKGFFPKTAKTIENKTFSFVHLDVDTYSSTLACLEFFYPRMSKGGIIISHDYCHAKGVKKAVDEFFADKPEVVLGLAHGTQCLIVKSC